jgi:glycerophosphoryl diester phosphodiesterase
MRVLFIIVNILLLSACAMTSHSEKLKNNKSSLPASNIPYQQEKHKIVIAHRGASGYLPEHSLAAKAMAYSMRANYIEQDVVMTKDDKLIILHDHFLDRVTDVMSVFPNRYRIVDGKKRWFAIDFTLAEIKNLRMTEGFTVDKKNQRIKNIYPERFPHFKSHFTVSTLQEEIELIQGLNHSLGQRNGYQVGLYVEIKAPWFHRHEGKDITLATLKVLKQYGYSKTSDKIYIQCFDANELQRIKYQLMPSLGINFKLVQLIAMTDWHETYVYKNNIAIPYQYDWMLKTGAMKKIAKYADGIGPWKPMIIDDKSTLGHIHISNLVNEAHSAGLVVHPYTFRKDAGRIPQYVENFDQLLDLFLYQVDVDGIFTDYTDAAVKFINQREQKK